MTHAPQQLQQRIRERLDVRRNYQAEIRALAAANRYVVFYGCGAILGSIVETWRALVGRPIDFCCDSNPAKWGRTFAGIPCISPAELTSRKQESTIFVTVGDYEPVLDYLASLGCPSVHLIYKYDLISSEYLAHQDLDAVASYLEEVRSMLADNRSIQVFDAILDRLLESGHPAGPMAAVFEGDQYFPKDLIALRPDEVFVEAGAFIGDTVEQFLQRSGGVFEAIHCFELDATNYLALQNCVARFPEAARITLHPEGLWNEPMEVTYSVEQSQSTIGAGNAQGRVVRLDDVLDDRRITFLKMDIEGAEGRALEGARRTIERHKPTLAICVYHHISDLWEIPRYIKSLVPEYRIYLRHHTKLEYETVCYALPPADSAGPGRVTP